jgi:ADP-glucose pyrophosphorylase
VSVGADASLQDVVALRGARIGQGCRLRRVLVAAGTQVPDGTELEDAAVGPADSGDLWVRSFDGSTRE